MAILPEQLSRHATYFKYIGPDTTIIKNGLVLQHGDICAVWRVANNSYIITTKRSMEQNLANLFSVSGARLKTALANTKDADAASIQEFRGLLKNSKTADVILQEKASSVAKRIQTLAGADTITKEKLLKAYLNELVAAYAWAKDQNKLTKYATAFWKTITSNDTSWSKDNLKSPAFIAACKYVGFKKTPGLKELRMLPTGVFSEQAASGKSFGIKVEVKFEITTESARTTNSLGVLLEKKLPKELQHLIEYFPDVEAPLLVVDCPSKKKYVAVGLITRLKEDYSKFVKHIEFVPMVHLTITTKDKKLVEELADKLSKYDAERDGNSFLIIGTEWPIIEKDLQV